jgi:hypothetical protein
MTTAELGVVGAFYGVETGPSAIGALIAGFWLRLLLGAVIDAPIFSDSTTFSRLCAGSIPYDTRAHGNGFG